jgi:urease accessory protein
MVIPTPTEADAGRAMVNARLLQLVSPGLPVGAYAYSQGLEWAVEARWVHDEASLGHWLRSLLHCSVKRVDVPLLQRLYLAWFNHDEAGVRKWSTALLAQRETSELRADERDRGQALARLLRDLGIPAAAPWTLSPAASFATLFALAAVEWRIGKHECLSAYVWAWLEGQVTAGVKLVPLGQVSGQRLLLSLADEIAAVVNVGLKMSDADIGASAPAHAIASSLHETQYTRLFRS